MSAPELLAPGLHALDLAVATGCGLLVGLEREHRKSQGIDHRAAGIRTFTVTAALGALAFGSGGVVLVAVGAAFLGALLAVGYYRRAARHPGVTNELALIATYLVGVQACLSPGIAAAAAAGLAALLAARGRLHRFATELLSEQELHDGLLLAALGLVVLPLVPDTPIALLAGINLRPLAAMVVLLLLMQALGHVALRALGARGGLAAAGFFGGFVSSTATVAAMGARARDEPGRLTWLAGCAGLSTVATWVQAIALVTALAPGLAVAVAPAAIAGLAGAALCSAALLARAPHTDTADVAIPRDESALSLPAALAIAGLLGGVTLGVTLAQQRFGTAGAMAGAALAGLADAHSPIASLAALGAAGGIHAREVTLGMLFAISANSMTRMVVSFATGGPAFFVRVGAPLATGAACAWGYALLVS